MAAGKDGGGGQRRRPPSVDIDGVVLLDKPEGLSSNAALQRARRCFSAAKAGHTGTLDPLATGLLPVCLGDATKFAQGLLDADKAYLATARLGIATDTGDREGRILAEAPVAATSEQVLAALATLTGTIEQVPPMYSALKHHGQPLYAIARAGGEVARAARTVHVHGLELVEWNSPLLTFRVRCSKGTYVRTLAEQIAAALGTVGHLVALRRTAVGPFDLGMSVDALVRGLPERMLGAQDALRVLQGRTLDPCPDPGPLDVGAPTDAGGGTLVRIYGPPALPGVRAAAVHGSAVPVFIGLGALEAGEQGACRLRPIRLIAHVAGPGSVATACAAGVSGESA
jgi:tRNA pseudouridine55 synthase